MDQLAMAARQSGAFPCHLWGETVGCHMIRVLDSAGSTLVEWGRQQQQQLAMANIIKYIIKFVVTIYVFWKILEHNLNVFLFIRAYGYYDDDNKDNDNTNNNVNNDNNGSNIINDMTIMLTVIITIMIITITLQSLIMTTKLITIAYVNRITFFNWLG